MHRRKYLTIAAGGCFPLAGCTDVFGDSSSNGDARSPEAVARAFWEAMFDGDVEGANELLHEDSPLGAVTQEDASEWREADPEVERTELVSQDGDTATVDVEISGEGDSGDRGSFTFTFELRRQNDKWRMYDDVTFAGDAGPAAPSVQWDVSQEGGADGITAVVYTHNGGDAVDASTVSARAGGETAPAPSGAGTITAGGRIVVPLDGDGDGYDPGSEVDLLWNDQGESQIIGEHTLSEATAGGLGDALRIE